MKNFILLCFAIGMFLCACKKNVVNDVQPVVTDPATGNIKLKDMGIVASNDSAFTISTYAGTGVAGSSNGSSPLTAQFDAPEGIVFDTGGNMFIADRDNHVIRKITTAGVVSVFAGVVGSTGNTNGSLGIAKFSSPIRLAIDAANNIYVADRDNARVRKITSAGVTSTIAGTTAGTGSTQFNWPIDVAVSSDGTKVYVADSKNHRIQKIILSGGVYTTSLLAGQLTAGHANATGSAASFNFPSGVAIDNSGNVIVADRMNHNIRKITSGGVVTTIAGDWSHSYDLDAPSSAATFGQPYGVTVANDGCIYVADIDYHNIRRISNHGGFVATIAGRDTAGYANGSFGSLFNLPTTVAIDNSGNLYVADVSNNRIRKLTPETRVVQYTEGWKVTTPYAGVTRYQYTGNRFWLPSHATDAVPNKIQNINVLDIDLDINHFDFKQVAYSSRTTITNIIGSPTNVIAAMSGTFATGNQTDYACYLRNNDITYWFANSVGPTNNYWHYHDGMFYVDANGTPGMELSDLSQNPFSPPLHKYMMSGAPMLINNSVPIEITNPIVWAAGSPSNLRPIIAARNAVALPVIGRHVLLITVDGIEQREDGTLVGDGSCYVPALTYYGMTTKDLTQFIQQFFHATYALNMDGGGSASMHLMGAGDNGGVSGGIGVISHPDWDAACNTIPGGNKTAYGQQRIIMQDVITVIAN